MIIETVEYLIKNKIICRISNMRVPKLINFVSLGILRTADHIESPILKVTTIHMLRYWDRKFEIAYGVLD